MLREKVTVGAGTEYPLEGLLTLPDDLSAPVPAVVMLHGSGASDLDERVMKLTPFKDLAEGLGTRGIASLRYNKRTFTYAKQLAKQDPDIRMEYIEDALRALEMLRNDPRIDKDRIYILGHSEGAMVAPRIDAEWGLAKGVILLAGTPYRLEEIVLRQFKQAGGKNPLVNWIVGSQYKKYSKKFERLYDMTDDEARAEKFAGNVSLYYFKEMGQKTAADYLLETDKPVLIAQGGRDFQVLADDDFKRFQELLAGKTNIEYRLYPDLDHCFVPALYDDILKAKQEYSTERHIPEEVIDDVARFIL
ncbi:MAG: alpha/beta fold hydrolase, partial [Firmicutes bacterium]|nr:alpha/beta fold hydrolase [Bacillota bacterium]